MTQGTLNISKAITLIIGGNVKTFKMGDFAAVMNNLDVFTMTGTSKPAKLAKYKQIAIENGYTLTATVWCQSCGFEGVNADVLNFNFTFTK